QLVGPPLIVHCELDAEVGQTHVGAVAGCDPAAHELAFDPRERPGVNREPGPQLLARHSPPEWMLAVVPRERTVGGAGDSLPALSGEEKGARREGARAVERENRAVLYQALDQLLRFADRTGGALRKLPQVGRLAGLQGLDEHFVR